MRGGITGSSAATCSCAPASRRLSSSQATPSGSSRGTWAAARLGQRGDLLLRARLPQAAQQLGHGVRVVEGDVGGGAVGQRGDLLLRARLPQAVQQLGHAGRVVEGDVGGGTGRPARRPAPARPPPAGCPAAWPRRPGRRGGRERRRARPARRPAPARPPPAGCPAAWPRRPGRRGRRGRQDHGRSSAATCSCCARLPQAVQQPGHAARVVEGDVGGRITGQQRGDLLVRARLPQAVQQPGHAARVVEGDVGGGPAQGPDVSAEVAGE